MATATAAPAQQQLSPQQINMMARQAVLKQAVPMVQPIFQTTVVPSQNAIINVQPRYVGLIRKFIVTVVATISNTDAALALTLSDLGLANLFSNITFTDLNNNQRINTTGWHISMLNSIKHRKPYASGYLVETDTMGGYGETYPILSSPASIAHGTTAQVRAVFEIPVTYSDDDLRGGIFANVVNATMNLALTFNQQPFTAAGVDSTLAVYKGTNAASITTATVTVYQDYLDQLPQGPNGVILPNLDMATVYGLQNTAIGGIVAGQDNPIQYANFRSFLSTFAIYNSNTGNDAGRGVGADINYWALQVANFTNLWKLFPLDQAQRTRDMLGTDLPKGCYYMSSRKKPIETTQYGNQELVINPITATAGAAQLLIGWENFALVNTLTQAGSLV
jgi:P3 major capsid protein